MRARRRQVKFPERVEGQPEIKNFLKAAGGSQPKIPQEMLVPTPDCEANKRTGTEAKKRKMELVCDEDDVLEPSLKRTVKHLRRKPSSCTEKLEKGTCTGKLEVVLQSCSSLKNVMNLKYLPLVSQYKFLSLVTSVIV